MTELAGPLVQDAEAWRAWLDGHHGDPRPERRQRRIANYLGMLRRGERLHR